MRLYAQPAEQFQLSEGTEGGWMGWLAGSQAGRRAGWRSARRRGRGRRGRDAWPDKAATRDAL